MVEFRLTRNSLGALLITGAVGLALWPAWAEDKKTPNLVANPSFEEVDSRPAHWSLGAVATGGKANLSVSDENPKSGKRCIRITGEAEWAAFVSNKIPIEKGKRYILSGWVRVNKGTGYIKIDYFNKDEYLDMTMNDVSELAQWTRQVVESEGDKLARATHITATLVGAGEFEVYFDDISVEAKEVKD
jgi:hypothetical protein